MRTSLTVSAATCMLLVQACTSASSSPNETGTSTSGMSSGKEEGGSDASSSTGVSSVTGGSASSSGTSSAGGSTGASSGSSAGSMASSSGSSGSGTSASGIGGAAAVVHDDFESSSLSSTWSLWNQYGVPNATYTPVTTIVVDTGHAHSGTHAVKIAGGGNGGGLFGTRPPAQSFYGRAWVYLSTVPSMGHWAMIVGIGPGAQPQLQVRIGGNLGVYDANIANPGDFEIRATSTPPPAQWMCIEFYYTTQSLQYWQGGQSILDIAPTTMWGNGQPPSPWTSSYADVAFGFAGENTTSVDTWIDDVALDTKRIGCN